MATFFIFSTYDINHPSEFDADIVSALEKIQRLGIPVLCQTVLLRGVNASVSILKELFEKLTINGILPYYLHQLDRVQGTAHFEVSEEKGRALLAEVSKLLSGYAIPKYVREEAGQLSKTRLT